MKNITLSADDNLIEQARLLARAQHKTLNALFREWLVQFTSHSGAGQELDSLMKRLRHVNSGQKFTRDDMNAR
jgi:hypothetical protein